MYSEDMRVVRSSRTLQKKLKAKEPWFIISNDFSSTREEIIKNYYHRFEIEETFKDIKHIFKNKPNWIKKISTLKTILIFQIIGIWIFFDLKYLVKSFRNIKKKLSWIKKVFEKIQAEIRSTAFRFFFKGKEKKLC